MKICPSCKAEIEDEVKFCTQCGSRLEQTDQENKNLSLHEQKKPARKVHRGKLILIVIGLLIAIAAAAVFAYYPIWQQKQYQEAIEMGEKYLFENDLTRAETEFLRALEIEPKESAPYVHLYQIYIEQDQDDKAADVAQYAANSLSHEDYSSFLVIKNESDQIREMNQVLADDAEKAEILTKEITDFQNFDRNKVWDRAQKLRVVFSHLTNQEETYIQNGKMVKKSELEPGKPAVIVNPEYETIKVYDSLDGGDGDGKLTSYKFQDNGFLILIRGSIKNGQWSGITEFDRIVYDEEYPTSLSYWNGKLNDGIWDGSVYMFEDPFYDKNKEISGTFEFVNGFPQVRQNKLDTGYYFFERIFTEDGTGYLLGAEPDYQYHVDALLCDSYLSE